MKKLITMLILSSWVCANAPADLTNIQCQKAREQQKNFGGKLCEQTLADPESGALQFALASLWLNQRTEVGNERLRRAYADILKGNEKLKASKVMTPAHASQSRVKWAMRGWLRVYYMFYDQSDFFPGRLEKDAQKKLEDLFWSYGYAKSTLARAKPEYVWVIQGSENHDMMDLSNAFLALQAVRRLPKYRNKRLRDGHTAEEHYQAWRRYYKLYCDERAKHGLFVEISPTYGKYFLPELVNVWEFAEDEDLQKKMEMLLHLTWADWAIDQLGGIRGGAKTRVYQGHYAQRGTSDSWSSMGRILIGKGDWFYTRHYEAQYVLALTRYRLPNVVIDLALNPQERGTYVYKSLRPAKLTPEPKRHPESVNGYWMDGDDPHVLRYSYCTPDYIMGSWMLDPKVDYAAINTQNRWQGVIFATDKNARIFPQCVGLRNGKTYNQHVAVQHKNVMIVQKNRVKSKQVGAMRVFFATGMKERLVERGEWLFLQEGDAYLAVSVLPRIKGSQGAAYQWKDDNWLHCTDDYAPVVFAAGRKEQYPSLEDFIAYIETHRYEIGDGRSLGKGILSYHFVDPDGDKTTLTMNLEDQGRLPKVNGQVIDLTPQMVFSSPYLTSKHDSGVVAIRKGDREMILDFNATRIGKRDQ